MIRDYLTGFHKRKLARKEASKAKALEREKHERTEARREVSCVFFSVLPDCTDVICLILFFLKKRRALAEQAARNATEVERAYGAADSGLSNISGAHLQTFSNCFAVQVMNPTTAPH